MEIDLIIPVYNESQNILKLVPELKKNISYKFRILFCYDSEDDDIFKILDKLKKYDINFKLIKNLKNGPCEAVKAGLKYSDAECSIVYPADDFHNFTIIDKMFNLFEQGYEIVVPSRFIKGGEMTGCPFLKSIIVRVGNYTLYKLSNIGVKDSSNGFRLFSKKILNTYSIISDTGFTYSIELLVKASIDGYKVIETPSKWIERQKGQSNFKVFKWINSYIYWYLYAIKYNLKKKINIK